jgi:hypothetical protein
MTKLALSHAKTVGSRHAAVNTSGKSARKNFPRFISRNPLKSLDPNERIQGNPNKSNSSKRDFRSETAIGQENPNGSTGPTPRPAAEKEPNRPHPKAKP